MNCSGYRNGHGGSVIDRGAPGLNGAGSVANQQESSGARMYSNAPVDYYVVILYISSNFEGRQFFELPDFFGDACATFKGYAPNVLGVLPEA